MHNLIENLKEIPSPLIVEGENASSLIDELNRRVLCSKQTACGQCPSCLKIAKGFHPDLLALKEYGMEDIRDALQRLHQRPYEASHRVLALYDFEGASPAIQNSLLKTLEEPSPRWKIWLGTKSRMALLATIRSRCLVIRAAAGTPASLDEQELQIFNFIADKDEWSLAPHLESLLKDREKTRVRFLNLLRQASEKNYPNHWQSMGPLMAEAINDLTRNLNPKIVWERIWTQSLI